MKELPRFTFGMGDRFGHQGEAQLKAVLDARAQGVDVAPVWNKSMREHTLIGTEPESLRVEADAAVKALGYEGDYFVDADHVNFETVDGFIKCSNFFTLDVAENLGKAPKSAEKSTLYVSALSALKAEIAKTDHADWALTEEDVAQSVAAFGGAVEAAGALYQKISGRREDADFAVEVSMDETDVAQGPKELLCILCMLAAEKVPAQTIAPKFTGRFNKGVDYVGDLGQFAEEFEADLQVLEYAVAHFDLPKSLKLSVHSGSDKFSLYSIIRELIEKYNAGLHIKTAGTTWLEEVIGLAEVGGAGLSLVKEIYEIAMSRMDELTGPYATVLDIDPSQLPSVEEAETWTSEQWVNAVDHDPEHPEFNSSLRQLFHVAFKLAPKNPVFFELLKKHSEVINRRVYNNMFRKHISKVLPAGVHI